jgi:hypothetical protein
VSLLGPGTAKEATLNTTANKAQGRGSAAWGETGVCVGFIDIGLSV